MFRNAFFRQLTLPLKHRVGPVFPQASGRGKVLDIGCSSGQYLSYLKELGWDTYGVEMDADTALFAKQKLGLNVVTGDFNALPFEPSSFDAVALWHSLEHFANPSATMRKVHSLLKKDGTVIIGLPNAVSLEAELFGNYWWAWEVPRHLYHFSPSTVTRLLEKEGFSVTAIEYPPNVNNLLLSIQQLLKDKHPEMETLARWCTPGQSALLTLLFLPLGYSLSMTHQLGRMLIHAKK